MKKQEPPSLRRVCYDHFVSVHAFALRNSDLQFLHESAIFAEGFLR